MDCDHHFPLTDFRAVIPQSAGTTPAIHRSSVLSKSVSSVVALLLAPSEQQCMANAVNSGAP